jgi:hypothetical protein
MRSAGFGATLSILGCHHAMTSFEEDYHRGMRMLSEHSGSID